MNEHYHALIPTLIFVIMFNFTAVFLYFFFKRVIAIHSYGVVRKSKQFMGLETKYYCLFSPKTLLPLCLFSGFFCVCVPLPYFQAAPEGPVLSPWELRTRCL